MEITLIIVGGLSFITFIAMVSDYLTKTKIAKSSFDSKEKEALYKRIEMLENRLNEQDTKITHLDNDVSFVNKLLEDKSK